MRPAVQSSGGPIYDPSVLPLSLWATSPFAATGAPVRWVGKASAGISGNYGQYKTGAIAFPVAGAAWPKGQASAFYDGGAAPQGTDTQAKLLADNITPLQFGSLVTLNAYTVSFAFNAPSAFAPEPLNSGAGGTPFQNSVFIGSDFQWGIVYSTSGVGLWHYPPSAVYQFSGWLPAAVGARNNVDITYDGAHARLRLNGGAWTVAPMLAVTNAFLTFGVLMGQNAYDIAKLLSANVLEMMVSPTVIADADLDKILGYRAATFG